MLSPASTLELFAREPQARFLKAGEVIFQEDEAGDTMFGILEGDVVMVVDGKEVEHLQAGDVFGEGALVQIPHTRGSTAIAKTNCKLVAIDQERFLFLIQETPLFALQVLRSYSSRLRHLKHGI